jgi:SAM-dependent methyltransferase
MLKSCPVCQRGEMRPSDTEVTIPEVLRQWETAITQPLKAEVWDDYREVGDQPVSLYTCSCCGFGQFHPILPGTEGFYEAISAADYYNADKWEFDVAASELLAAGANSVLDVGCGSGIFLEYLRKRIPDASLYGYELNGELLDRLVEKGFGVLPGDTALFGKAMEHLPRFDAICMLQVLEHVGDPIEFLRTFLPLLRPGGRLIITTPNSEGPIRAFPRALTEVPPHHTTRWTERSFRALLSAQTLNVRRIQLEPLPDYLWDSYLPVVWDEPIWPTRIFDPIARASGLETIGERAGFAAQAMREAGIRWLQDVPGHTIFVSATLATEQR